MSSFILTQSENKLSRECAIAFYSKKKKKRKQNKAKRQKRGKKNQKNNNKLKFTFLKTVLA